jgi:hypothetical protein
LGIKSGEGLAFNFWKSLDFGWLSKILRLVMIAGRANKNPYPGWRHHRVATPQAIVIHEIGRWDRPYRMAIRDNHFPVRRELMPMPVETGFRAPMAGHTAKIAFKRPDGSTLEELPKQEVKKSSLRDSRERHGLNQASRQYRDNDARTVTRSAHGEIHSLKTCQRRFRRISGNVEASLPFFSWLSASVRIQHG